MKNALVSPLDMGALARGLLADTGTSRVTVRLDVKPFNFPVVAEALSDGARSLTGAHALDQRNLPTVRWLMETRQLLVQDDLRAADPPAPAALIDQYGVVAQMLAPLVYHDCVFGWISVHECKQPRTWSLADREALSLAANTLSGALLGDLESRERESGT